MLPEHVTEKLDALPANPGVYLFKDKKGAVVYVGKAKSLRARVRSYFQAGSSDVRYFVAILQKSIGDLETIVTATEKEATILEGTLIKEHRPRYNVKLRDDKEYLSLRLDPKAEWPRLDVVRRPKQDGARYFGPYHSATAARRTLHLINKHFQLRTCSDMELKMRKRPCLQHQIKRCPAPCVYEVDRGWYADQVNAVAMFLDGRHDELSAVLNERMKEAAREMRFELAAVFRDQLAAIEKVREEQRVVTVDTVDRDIIGLYREGEVTELGILHVRAGKLAEVVTISIKGTEVPDEEVIAAFLAQHYGAMPRKEEPAEDADASSELDDAFIPAPREIIVPVMPEASDGICDWLADRTGHPVALVCPKRGPRVGLLEMANANAKHAFMEKRRAKDDVMERLTQIKERLRLPTIPRRIECCDISHLAGGDTVGAVVCLTDGVPDKKRYRTYHVKTVGVSTASGVSNASSGPAGDDYGAMYEVLARRFRRGEKARRDREAEVSPSSLSPDPALAPALALAPPSEDPPPESLTETALPDNEWELPDLFVVDGGRGQLGVALTAAHDLGLHDLPIVGLAKEKENVLGDKLVDRVYLPGQKNPIPLRAHSSSLFFLARARDEAHRFANRGRKVLGKKRRLHSALDDVKGLGPSTRKALLRTLGSLDAVKKATDEALLAVPGVTARHVKALRAAFPREESVSP